MSRIRNTSVPGRVSLFFLAVSVLWIELSDHVARWLVTDPDRLTVVQSYKGLGFVLVVSVSLYGLVSHYVRRLAASTDHIRHAYDETLAGWAAALDIRDHSTAEHTRRVTELTVELAGRFDIEGDDLENIRRGATLHDIGKMGVPDSVLSKPGALDEEEWVQMRRHPDLAVEMLKGIDYLRPALVIPWCHHEKWDGSGYPRGLAGADIPLPARLFAIIDVYDAVTSERPYRRPMTSHDALALVQAGAGSHFDPAVVDEFIDMVLGAAEPCPVADSLATALEPAPARVGTDVGLRSA